MPLEPRKPVAHSLEAALCRYNIFDISQEFTLLRSAFLLLLLFLALVLRWYSGAHQYIWYDEWHSFIRAHGYTEREVTTWFANPMGVSVGELFERIHSLNRAHGKEIIASLAEEDSHHPPFYYLMLAGWGRMFGGGVLPARLLSVLLGGIAILTGMWLLRECENDSRIITGYGFLAAISPLHVAYSTEIREYIFVGALALATSAAFVRQERQWALTNTILFGVLSLLSWYTSLVTGLLTAAQMLVFLALRFQDRSWERLRNMAAVMLVALVLFVPWITIAVSAEDHSREAFGWVSGYSFSVLRTPKLLVELFSIPFVDVFSTRFDSSIFYGIVCSVLLFLLVPSFHLLSPISKRMLLAGLFSILVIAVWDVVSGGIRVSVLRLFIGPLFIIHVYVSAAALQLALSGRIASRWILPALLFVLAISSDAIMFGKPLTRAKPRNKQTALFTEKLRELRPSQILASAQTADILALVQWLPPATLVKAEPVCSACAVNFRKTILGCELQELSDGTIVFMQPPPSDKTITICRQQIESSRLSTVAVDPLDNSILAILKQP